MINPNIREKGKAARFDRVEELRMAIEESVKIEVAQAPERQRAGEVIRNEAIMARMAGDRARYQQEKARKDELNRKVQRWCIILSVSWVVLIGGLILIQELSKA